MIIRYCNFDIVFLYFSPLIMTYYALVVCGPVTLYCAKEQLYDFFKVIACRVFARTNIFLSRWNFNQRCQISFEEHVFWNVVYNMAVISFVPQCFNEI